MIFFAVIIKIQKKDIADKELANIADEIMHSSDSGLRERVDAALVKTAMKSKIFLGMGVKY
jgi:hypothetical protein